VSLRAANSSADADHPEGRVDSRFFRGSGTSQSAAVVSGAAALVIQQRPSITPDQVKALLTSTATPLPEAGEACQGAGLLDLDEAIDRRTPSSSGSMQQWARSTGLGSLDAARGSARLSDDGDDDDDRLAGGVWNGKSWSGDTWSGTSWSGTSWSGKSWSGKSWSGKSWSGKSWSGKSWSDASWSGKSWSDSSWSGSGWNGTAWSASAWQ